MPTTVSPRRTGAGLNPTIAEARLPRAWHLAMFGREEDAQAEIETALRLNPECGRSIKKQPGSLSTRQARRRRPGTSKRPLRSPKTTPQPGHAVGSISGARRLGTSARLRRKVIEPVEAALSRNPDNGAALPTGPRALPRSVIRNARANGSIEPCCSTLTTCTCATTWPGRCSASSTTRSAPFGCSSRRLSMAATP